MTKAAALRWSMAVINLLWEYTHQIWHFRNHFLHGTGADQARKTLQEIWQEVTALYSSFQWDPTILLSWHHHLFTHKYLQDHLSQPCDDVQCWLYSVAEAKADLQHQQDILCIESTHFFPATHLDVTSLAHSRRNPTLSSPQSTASTVTNRSYPILPSSQSLDSTVTYQSSNGTQSFMCLSDSVLQTSTILLDDTPAQQQR